jgi:hypothetical protein
MRKIGVVLIMAMVVFCGCSENDKQAAGSKAVEITGIFEDTVWTAETGTKYVLKLQSDSSFYLYVRILGSKDVMQTYLGKYEPNADWSEIVLKSTDGKIGWKCGIGAASDMKLFAEGQEVNLQRTVQLIEKNQGVVVYDRILPQNSSRSLAFQRTDNYELIVDRKFLSQLSGEHKAVLCYYAYRYNSGCANSDCWLTKGLGYNQADLMNVLSIFLSPDSLTKPWYIQSTPMVEKPELRSLFVLAQPNGALIQYVAMGGKGNLVSFTDKWKLNDLKWAIVSHEANGVTSKVLYDSDVKVQLPKEEIIINVQK